MCAMVACEPLKGTGDWQNICPGIDAFEITGGCTGQLAQFHNGGNPYNKTYQNGFHGIWNTFIDGIGLGDNANSIKLTCTE